MAKRIRSRHELIKELGGVKEVARVLGAKRSAVSNWLLPERTIPPDTYLAFQKLMKARGLSAPPHLWGMREAAE